MRPRLLEQGWLGIGWKLRHENHILCVQRVATCIGHENQMSPRLLEQGWLGIGWKLRHKNLILCVQCVATSDRLRK